MKGSLAPWALAALLAACGAADAPASKDTAAAAPGTDVTAPPAIDTEQLRIGLASSAKSLCSSVLVAGRSREHVEAEELEQVSGQGFSFELTEDPAAVVASAAGEIATVLYRPHLGCTLVDADEVDSLLEQFDADAYPAPAAPDPARPWPAGSAVTLPERLEGVDLDAVNSAVDAAFVDADPDNPARSRAVVVVHDGRIIAERYAPPFDAATPQLGWSMTKTVTGALTGILAGDGKLDPAAPAPVAEWQAEGDPRRQITLDHLLRMSSGLAFSEVYTAESESDVVLMLFGPGADDMGAFTADKPAAYPPGSEWSYASGTTNLIARLHRLAFDDQQAYFEFPRRRLFEPLGMTSAVIEPDVSGTFVGSSYMYATPRDWAKIGLLYLQDGVWNGERILPEGWVEYSLTPAPAAPEGQYGAQIWLNRGAANGGRPHPTLPEDMYYLSGFEGQNVVVVPSRGLVVVRMGLTRGEAPRPVWKLVETVLQAIG